MPIILMGRKEVVTNDDNNVCTTKQIRASETSPLIFIGLHVSNMDMLIPQYWHGTGATTAY